MLKMARTLIPMALVALPLLHAPVGAAEDENHVVELNTYLCKDIMRMSGEDRSVALAAYHGYVLGKKGATSISVGTLNKISNEFIEQCLDNPKEKALATFIKLAQ
jgi:malate/lactate dehydrogenase